MAKKDKKIEKETRRLMETVADMIKKKSDGRYKFKKGKKKQIKAIKRSCPHWIPRKGKPVPTTTQEGDMWVCRICGARFPVKPLSLDEYYQSADKFLELVNQMQFWAVKMGGDKRDTEMFLRLKMNVPRFKRVAKQIHKRVNSREAWETNKNRAETLAQFSMYSGFNYKG